MRNPHRWRNIGLAFVVSGIVALIPFMVLSKPAVDHWAVGIAFVYGLMAIIFGGYFSMLSHRSARAQEALLRGEGILARWCVDAATWRAFVEVNGKLNWAPDGLLNELSIVDEAPDGGIEVIVGKEAVQVGGSIHSLPLRGTPEITGAVLDIGRYGPSFIEFQLFYPGGGHGASGVPQAPVRRALRVPVAANAQREAKAVIAHYNEGRSAPADFFHGAGDGSDAEDLNTCYSCGYQTHQYRSRCPQCGGGMQTRRWSRRFGWGMLACGLFITVLIGAVLYYTAPMLLRPGVSTGGARFSGTPGQALFVFAILGVVGVFGVTALLYGVWQIRTGRANLKIAGFLAGIFALLLLVAVIL